MWPVMNDVETGSTPRYPDLQPQDFEAPARVLLEECEAVARTQRRWTVDAVDVEGLSLSAVYRTRLGFRDEVTIRLQEASEGGRVRVVVRSRSRMGGYDLGQNARTIRRFQRALSDAVGARLERRESGT